MARLADRIERQAGGPRHPPHAGERHRGEVGRIVRHGCEARERHAERGGVARGGELLASEPGAAPGHRLHAGPWCLLRGRAVREREEQRDEREAVAERVVQLRYDGAAAPALLRDVDAPEGVRGVERGRGHLADEVAERAGRDLHVHEVPPEREPGVELPARRAREPRHRALAEPLEREEPLLDEALHAPEPEGTAEGEERDDVGLVPRPIHAVPGRVARRHPLHRRSPRPTFARHPAFRRDAVSVSLLSAGRRAPAGSPEQPERGRGVGSAGVRRGRCVGPVGCRRSAPVPGVWAPLLRRSNRRDPGGQPRDRVPRHLRGPRRVDRPERGAEQPEIEREVRHEERVAAEAQARREEQAHRRALLAEAAEVSELRDGAPARIDDHDLVRLVRDDPEVVVRVHDDAIRAVDARHEDLGRARRAAAAGRPADHRHLHDRVVAGVRHEERRLLPVEAQPVRAERRDSGRAEQRIVHPDRRDAAGAGRPPDDALEGVRDVDVPGAIERDVVEARPQRGLGERRERHEHARGAGVGVDREDLGGAEVDDEERARLRVEREAEEVRARPGDGDLSDEPPGAAEDEELAAPLHRTGGREPEGRHVRVPVGVDLEPLRGGRAVGQGREGPRVESIPRDGEGWDRHQCDCEYTPGGSAHLASSSSEDDRRAGSERRGPRGVLRTEGAALRAGRTCGRPRALPSAPSADASLRAGFADIHVGGGLDVA